MWLDVKIKSNSLYGVQYFWKIVFPSRKLPNDVKENIYKVFPNNACFTHPEHLILAMLYDLENTSSNLQLGVFSAPETNKTKILARLHFFKAF